MKKHMEQTENQPASWNQALLTPGESNQARADPQSCAWKKQMFTAAGSWELGGCYVAITN